jgi:uncharacterized membrane protein YgcG
VPVRSVARLVAAFVLLGTLVGAALAPTAAGAGDTPIRIPDHAIYDLAAAFDVDAERSAESLAATIRSVADADVVVVSETVDAASTPDAAYARAEELLSAMEVGGGLDGGGLVIYFSIQAAGCDGLVAHAQTDTFASSAVSADDVDRIVKGDITPFVASCDLDSALLVGMSRIGTAVLTPAAGGGTTGGVTVDAGPPFPDPADGVAVYDNAGILGADTIAAAEKTIDAIEARTGAEVALYTQVVEDGRTTDEADGDARALMDQWGVGRKGFDDGLVILFDMYPGLKHGQVILYGGPGFLATFLSNADKQRIYENDMLPRLKAGDFDGAVLVALERVDAAATPENAQKLDQARQVNAIGGLVVAPLLAVLFIGAAAWAWLRYGRDPVYLDDPSIHMAGPPEALTPDAAVFVLAGGSSRRALTTAMLDLASRGEVAFREETLLLGLRKRVGIETKPADPDPETRARQLRNSARALGPAEELIRGKLEDLGGSDGYIEPDEVLKLGASVPAFDKALETEVVARGWFRERPSAAIARWVRRAFASGLLGAIAVFVAVNLPSSGLLLIGIGMVVSGVVVGLLARSMPAVSLPGAMIRAMLAAYRRTLKKTMDQARSMDQVVADAGLAWLETPDQAVVWGTALGLHAEIESVLGRAIEDEREGRVAPGTVWLPTWYGSSAGGGASGFAGDFAGAGPGSGGLFSNSGVPDFGGMMSALGSIGNSPSSSGSGGSGGGGGGFGGGGSGGGGGGSGGGF